MRVGELPDASLKPRRGHARGLSECRRERAGLAEPHFHSDRCDRGRRVRQQRLGSLDATVRVESMRRHAERLLERSAEMIRTEARELSEGGEGDLICNMLLDIVRDGA
jgi:hypothetical protein